MELLACALTCPARAEHRVARNAKLPPAAVSSEDDIEPQLTIRPAPGLELLAARVVRVLSLRFGQGAIRIAGPPPPGLLEAVPAGHLALARDGERVRLVLGAAFGAFFEASVRTPKDATESDVRALALAVEALRDRVVEAADRTNLAAAQAERAEQPQPTAASASPPAAARSAGPRDYGISPAPPLEGESPREVKPMWYLRMYSGASSEGEGLRMGAATGGGLCVQGHCLVISVETPLPILESQPTDVRYRYPTITSSFYSRPWRFGIFAPAASIGFLSRIGYFNEDMGLRSTKGLDTDLGVRGTLEAGFQVYGALDLTTEFGIDYALDRWQLGSGENVAQRGDRAMFWAQAGLRVRPY
ncbi:MAG TPA: hypothetical protein VJR89_19595 [Polyangiales bacterium]|nr:hypothetical protein [Polyangiales bacterium]